MADIILKRKLYTTGNSIVIVIPTEHLQYINAKDGDTISILAKDGKKGKYLALWKEGS